MSTEQLVIDKIFLNNLKLAKYVVIEFRSNILRNTQNTTPCASGKVNILLEWYDNEVNCRYEKDNITGRLYYGIFAKDSENDILHPNDYINLNIPISAYETRFLTNILQKGDKLSFEFNLDNPYGIHTIDLRFTIERKKETFQIPLTILRKSIYNGNILNYR